ncbi:maleylacetate reductase [Pseudonocardia benzenivorans]|uniref:Maleylacetate reductase n=1 Tax=Pseudonocardia benzenivorans TaxID=228005 RepID=A0ABW3VPS7_9PSEU
MITPPQPFVHEARPMRVRFGAALDAVLADEVRRAGLRRTLVVCSPGQVGLGDRAAAALGELSAGVFAEARVHVPAETVERAVEHAARVGADGCVAVGGGSAVGLAKAVALHRGLPIVAVPTTYAGSEMTPVWGITRDGLKTTGRDSRVLPTSVVYDPELSVGLPMHVTMTSGLNAIAHAVEALYAPDANPVTSLLATEGIRAMTTSLTRIADRPVDRDARATALYGSWLCGACLGATTMSLHHKLCHALGGTLDLPHAETHAVLLPHALAYNQDAAPVARRTLAELLGSTDPALALWELARTLGAPRSLAELGMAEADIGPVAEQVVAHPYANPAPVTPEGVDGLLRAAWSGRVPGRGGR